MLNESIRPISHLEKSSFLRVAILDTIKDYCEGVKIGSPKIIALHDIAVGFSLKSLEI